MTRAGPIALVFAASLAHAASPDGSLEGCWRSERIVQHLAGGATNEDRSGRCVLTFADDRFESRCLYGATTVSSTYQFRIVRPNVYAATMTGSSLRTSLVGSTRESEYRVEGDRLVIITNGPAGRVESHSRKVACAAGG